MVEVDYITRMKFEKDVTFDHICHRLIMSPDFPYLKIPGQETRYHCTRYLELVGEVEFCFECEINNGTVTVSLEKRTVEFSGDINKNLIKCIETIIDRREGVEDDR